jgi:hypothetical protein
MKKTDWTFPRHRDYERALRDVAAAWFASKGFAVSNRYGYILANRDEWHQNIILPEVANYIKAEKEESERQRKNYPLHRWIHHGLSSQAMLFNLIGPLIVLKDFDPLRTVFEKQGISWPLGDISAEFEFDKREVFNETQGQPTSVDLVLRNDAGEPIIFVEAKLVEKEFGGCSLFSGGDCDGRNPAKDFSLCYLHNIDRWYWKLMDKHKFLDNTLAEDSTCIMTSYYQFFREALMALELGGDFVLLCDHRSPTFAYGNGEKERGMMPFLLSLLPEKARKHIAVVTIQDVAEAIRASGRHEWINEFEAKYGLV